MMEADPRKRATVGYIVRALSRLDCGTVHPVT
jgi:hypothetical protein